MRLEPVYLVAPKSARSMPTRRAFLLAGGTFAFGASLGGACGYAMGAGAAADGAAAPVDSPPVEPAPLADEPLPKSGDVELDELRRLAVKAPIEELVQHRPIFVALFTKTYRGDEFLWKGIDRLSTEVIARADFPNRRIAAQGLAQAIEGGAPGLKKLLGARVQTLRSIK